MEVLRNSLGSDAIARHAIQVVARVIEVVRGEGKPGNVLVGQAGGWLVAGVEAGSAWVVLLLIF